LSTGVFWLFIPHLLRGFIGLKINSLLPKSHEIIKQLGFQDEEGGMSFKKVHLKIKA